MNISLGLNKNVSKNQAFVPTAAKYPKDIQKSLEIQEPLINEGYQQGPMLVIQNGIRALQKTSNFKLVILLK